MNKSHEDTGSNDCLHAAKMVGITTGMIGLISGFICIVFVHDVSVELMTNDLINWITVYYDDVKTLEFTMRLVGASMIMSGIIGFVFAYFCHHRIRYKESLFLSIISGIFGVVLLIGLIAWIATYYIRKSKDTFAT